jgi:predicted DNA binding CopG/RHH family protein
MKTKIDSLNETTDAKDDEQDDDQDDEKNDEQDEVKKPKTQQNYKKAIKDLRKMSNAVNLPTISKLLMQVRSRPSKSPSNKQRAISKKFTAKMISEGGQFGLTEDIYASRTAIDMAEEKSEVSSKSDYRYGFFMFIF